MKLLATILILAGAAYTALADTSLIDTEYFHPAASLYIHGNTAAANELLTKGLNQYPNDAKLNRLKALMEQRDQQNQKDQQDQQNQKDQQQDQQKQDEQNQKEQEQEQNDQQNDGQEQQQEQSQQPQRAEEMSADEAKQLLDAMKQEEKNERMGLKVYYGPPVNVEKDW